MKLTRASSYAVHALAHMAQEKAGRPLPSHLVAEARGIPERFLLKVLKPLVSARVLRSVKGPHGGYQLLKEPADVSLLEIVEAVDGPLRGQAPFIEEGNAALNKRLDAVCLASNEIVREQLKGVSLADLIAAKGGRKKVGS
jgi:Rrf2 family protein